MISRNELHEIRCSDTGGFIGVYCKGHHDLEEFKQLAVEAYELGVDFDVEDLTAEHLYVKVCPPNEIGISPFLINDGSIRGSMKITRINLY